MTSRLPRPVLTRLAPLGLLSMAVTTASAQEPVSWGEELTFHTFSIAAVDPDTGESGVAVTTRVACVGNGVPWLRVGVGAVATQASTRTEYGKELLDMLELGLGPREALDRALAADEGRDGRQVGVVSVDGRAAQHTGDGPSDWKGHRSGPNYAAQGNSLVGPEVVDAVAETFERSAGTGRHLADRLIEALAAGQAAGGDRRKGRLQSAAVVVVDPRQGMARREDGQTVHINVCEHPTPVAELRRVYATVSGTLGFRELSQPSGADVVQLKLILHALGFFRTDDEVLNPRDLSPFLDDETAAAVDRFRSEVGLSTPRSGGSPPGLVDAETLSAMWAALEEAGLAVQMRLTLRDLTIIRR